VVIASANEESEMERQSDIDVSIYIDHEVRELGNSATVLVLANLDGRVVIHFHWILASRWRLRWVLFARTHASFQPSQSSRIWDARTMVEIGRRQSTDFGFDK
jgi:hypothetical protein